MVIVIGVPTVTVAVVDGVTTGAAGAEVGATSASAGEASRPTLRAAAATETRTREERRCTRTSQRGRRRPGGAAPAEERQQPGRGLGAAQRGGTACHLIVACSSVGHGATGPRGHGAQNSAGWSAGSLT